MKNSLTALALVLVTFTSNAQEIQRALKPFSKIIASPKINVVLEQGEREHIRLVYDNVSSAKINIVERGNTLHIYLDDAKKIERNERLRDLGSSHTMYENVHITAYITYTQLQKMEIRGNQQLTVLGAINNEHFTLRAYGQNIITISALNVDFFKAALYGENKLRIKDGKVVEQKYRLYGENRIDTKRVKSAYASTSIFGQGDVRLTSTEEVRVNAFGEPDIQVNGGAQVNKRLIFGNVDIVEQ